MTSISILISARNEEKVIQQLLDSIDNLSYPKENLQVLIANDSSEDRTLEILQAFAKKNTYIEIIDLEPRNENEELYGKARALAIMAHKATGDYLFFTDADIILPRNWIQGFLSEINLDVGVMVGVTGMKTTGLWATLQSMEWLSAFYTMKILSNCQIATTGSGNNMMVLKEAYFKIGGYEKIGFSIIEDYRLYTSVIASGYEFKQVFNKDVVAYTSPPEDYFEQRKRWISGANKEASTNLRVGLFLQSGILFIYFALAIISPLASIFLFGMNSLFLIFATIKAEQTLKISGYRKYLPIFIFYLPIIWFMQLLYYFYSPKVKWKGRVYD